MENKKRGKNEKLADAYINVTKIPSSKSIEQQFSEIEKIKRVTFRLYPLNGDIEINGIFDGFRRQLENVNSKSGNMSINTPKDKMEVSKLISAAGDKADTVLKAVSIDGVEKDFKNEDFSEKIPIYLPEEEEEIYKNIAYAINQVVEKDEIKNVSNENKKNYRKY